MSNSPVPFSRACIALLSFIGLGGLVPNDDENECTKSNEHQSWTQVDVHASPRQYLMGSCEEVIFSVTSDDDMIETTNGYKKAKQLLQQLYEEQKKYESGYDVIRKLSIGQRKSLLSCYEDGLIESGYYKDVDAYVTYKRLERTKLFLQHYMRAERENNATLLLELQNASSSIGEELGFLQRDRFFSE